MRSLQEIEFELKKRLPYHYSWGQKQNDIWDKHTNFIYETENWETLIEKIKTLVIDKSLDKRQAFNYAANRWYNFWSAQAVEQIFSENAGIRPVFNSKDSEKDFYLFNIPFDHKTTVFPKQFGKAYKYAKEHKRELIEWLYKNQSSQKRHHFKNRLFIVVYDFNGEHWKLKAEIGILKKAINGYVRTFKNENLQTFTFVEGEETVSDIIWVVR